MEKLKMQTADMAERNIEILGQIFPNCLTEVKNDEGKTVRAIDFDKLRQELACEVVEGAEERYQFTWPDKRNAIRLANAPTNKTLRPCREESVDFDNTENLYIEGDNLEVLKLLRENYLGKVKMIYIDPPYNTGNDFVYNDDFAQGKAEFEAQSGLFDEEGRRMADPMVQNTESNGRFHTDWLNMIYPRLKVAKDLLSDDGVIFISIDDNEIENLKKICNEVFGEQNFIGVLSVENNPKGRKNSAFISVSSEYCVIYAREKTMSYFIENVPKQASDMTLDENGRYVHNSGKRVLVGENSFNNKVSKVESDKNYSVYYRAKDESIILKKEELGQSDESLILSGYKKYYSYCKNHLVENTYTEAKLLELHKLKALDFSNDKIYEKNFNDTIRIKSLLVNKEYEAIVRGVKQKYSMELTTTGAGTILKSLFDSKDIFTAPKNPGFIKLLISLLDDKEFIVLDFFSGSASTAHSVMRLNAEDGGHRKFIMVQWPEDLDVNLTKAKPEAKTTIKNAIDFLDKLSKPHTISEIGKERIRRAGEKITAELIAKRDNIKTELYNITGGAAFDSNPSSMSYFMTKADETKKNKATQLNKELIDLDSKIESFDTGFRVLKLDTSNMADVYYTPADTLIQTTLNFDALVDNIREGRTAEDLLFQVLPECNLPLSSKIEIQEIHGKKVFVVEDGYLMACFDKDINESVITAIAKEKPYYFVMCDRSIATDNVADNFDQIFNAYSKETVRRIL